MRKTCGPLTHIDHHGSQPETRVASLRPVIGRFAVEVAIGVTVKRVLGITGMRRAHGGFFLFGPSHSPVPGLRRVIPCGAICAGVGFDAHRPRVIPETSLNLPNAAAH